MFSVLTLNLRFGLADDGPNNWQHRKQYFPSLLKKYRTDFMGFQEANDFQVDFLKEILMEYGYIGQRSPAPLFWQNNIIFYKNTWSCMFQEHFFLSPTPTIPSRFRKSRWPRQCTVGMFKNETHQLICINTHFDFDESVQIESAKLIMERLARLPSHVPAILMGDFNSAPFTPCQYIFIGNNQTSNSKGGFFKNTFNRPFPGTHHDFTGKDSGDHIDWILYRGNISQIEHKVIRDTFNGRYPSDHFPLVATFKWQA